MPDRQARRLFTAAVHRFIDDDTGRIRMNSRLGAGSIVSESRFRLSERSLEARVDFGEDGEEGVQVSLVAIDDHAWFRIDHAPGRPAQRCWTRADVQDIRDVTGYDLPSGPLGVPPAAAVVILAEPRSGTADRVAADVNLYLVAAAIFGSTPQHFGIDPRTEATARISFSLYKGRVTGWTISFGDLLRAVQAGGGTVPDDAADHLDDPDLGMIYAQFYDPGDPVDLTPPPREQVVEFSGNEAAYERALATCRGALA